ncbi:MAG: hypothetical protein WC690_03325 [bacterium]
MQPQVDIARIKRKALMAGVLGTLAIALAAWIIVHSITGFFIRSLGQNLMRISSDLASRIDADEHAQIQRPSDMNSANYAKITRLLEDFQRATPDVVSAYTMRVAGESAALIVSPPVSAGATALKGDTLQRRDTVGIPYMAQPDIAMRSASAGIAAADRRFTTDRWGTWLTACAPLKRSEGTIDGIVCVDKDKKSATRDMVRVNTIAVILAFACALLLWAMLVVYVMKIAVSHQQRGSDMKKLLLLLVAVAVAVPALARADQCKEPEKASLKPGMKVVAQWQGDNWWLAKIASINKKGLFNVTYSDNTKGSNKKQDQVAYYIYDKSGTPPPCFKEGDKVVAQWKGDSWWKARITKIDGSNADITYSDGEKGKRKLTDMVRDPW